MKKSKHTLPERKKIKKEIKHLQKMLLLPKGKFEKLLYRKNKNLVHLKKLDSYLSEYVFAAKELAKNINATYVLHKVIVRSKKITH